MNKKISVISMLIPIMLVLTSTSAFASEGQFNLTNQEGTDAECKAFSVFMPTFEYSILMTCRQIVYPGNTNEFNYVAWAESSENGDYERLGTIGVGKVEFETNEPFRRLFVTREASSRPRTPSTNVVMIGNLSEFQFNNIQTNQNTSPIPQQTPTSSPLAEQSPSLISRLFRPGTLLALGGVSLLLVLVFILTRR